MQTVASLLQLHSEAHHCLSLLLAHCSRFGAEELCREHGGFGYPSLLLQFQHLLECEDTWVARLKLPGGGDLPFVWAADEAADSVEELEALRQRIAKSSVAYLSSHNAASLNQPLELHSPGKGQIVVERLSPAFVMLHVITHHFHHKGQAAAICRLLGQPAPDTDIQRLAG